MERTDFSVESHISRQLAPLVLATELRDSYTRGHAERVGIYASTLARLVGMDDAFCRKLYLAGLIHDLGKVGIPDDILLKPGRLEEEEYAIIRLHSTLSAKIIEQSDTLKELAPVVKAHHENYDGSGYPDGLSGEDIPLMARYLAIADVFDALTTRRIYRDGLGLEETIAIMTKERHKFDPKLFDLFLQTGGHYFLQQVKDEEKTLYPELEKHRAAFFFKDPLTGLLNRQALLAYLQKGARRGYGVFLAHLNIRGFSLYNKEHGMRKGDKLLRCVAENLLKALQAHADFEEIRERRVYLFRDYADRFFVLSFSKRHAYLLTKIDEALLAVSRRCGLELYRLGEYAHAGADAELILREVGYLL